MEEKKPNIIEVEAARDLPIPEARRNEFEKAVEKTLGKQIQREEIEENLKLFKGGLTFKQFKKLSKGKQAMYLSMHPRPETDSQLQAKRNRALRSIKRRKAHNRARVINFANGSIV